jgi:hypothetical protein
MDEPLKLSDRMISIPIEHSPFCQCEHRCHFDEDGEGGVTNHGKQAHPYGKAEKGATLMLVITSFGKFEVCQACKDDCLSLYLGDRD